MNVSLTDVKMKSLALSAVGQGCQYRPINRKRTRECYFIVTFIGARILTYLWLMTNHFALWVAKINLWQAFLNSCKIKCKQGRYMEKRKELYGEQEQINYMKKNKKWHIFKVWVVGKTVLVLMAVRYFF